MANEQNLKPFTKGSRHASDSGKKSKRGKSLQTLVRELESDDFDWKHVPLKNKEAVKQMGSPWKAIVTTAIGQAVSGDKSAREWLRKSGYGDKLDVTSNGETVMPILGAASKDVHSNPSDD